MQDHPRSRQKHLHQANAPRARSPTLQQRRIYHQAMDCFNNITNNEEGLHYMYEPLNRTRTTHTTGTNCMTVPNIRSCTGRKAYSYKGPTFWNSLDVEARCITEKEKLKKHINKLTCRDVNHPG